MIAITLDGPAGVGKSTVARLVAQQLPGMSIDSGAILRLAASMARRHDLDSVPRLIGLIDTSDLRAHDLHTGELDDLVSRVAGRADVQAALSARLHDLVDHQVDRCIVEGRSIGLNVFPDAPLKVFLTASTEVRAQRRAQQLDLPVGIVLERIEHRDEIDSSRPINSTSVHPDALIIDASALEPDEVTDIICDEFRRLAGPNQSPAASRADR